MVQQADPLLDRVIREVDTRIDEIDAELQRLESRATELTVELEDLREFRFAVPDRFGGLTTPPQSSSR